MESIMTNRLLLATNEPVLPHRTSPAAQPAPPICPIIQAQTEVVGAMLKAMIIASGGRVDGPSERR
jgi:hypothetical protein